jgi:hypothetical protein
VDVVDRRCESDNEITVERDNEVMALVGEEFTCPPSVDRAVEDVRRDVVEDMRVRRAE